MKTNELAYFTNCVNTLIEGKLILVDKHIASVLQCVAKTPALCKCLAETIKSMSYATEFSRAKVTLTRADGTVESSLKMPADRDRLFVFVVCLLTEVDSGRRNLLDFLRDYYNEGTNDLSYAKFANEVLKPFKHAGENILRTVDPESLNTENAAAAQKFFQAEKIYVETAVVSNVFATMQKVNEVCQGLQLSNLDRAEATMVTEYFVNALYLKNPKILRLAWIAYRNTLAKHADLKPLLDAIANLLANVAM